MNFILQKIRSALSDYTLTGHSRSIKAKKNILALLFRKGIGVIISFLLVPLTINYLSPVKYGIWLTLSSFISWFYFFDIGLGNGFRNKFAESLAKGEKEEARIYASTTYALMIIISASLLIFFWVANPFLDWIKIFNAPPELKNELSFTVGIVFVFFCFQFVIQIINTILTADQKPAIAGYFSTIANLLTLIIIYILMRTTTGSLVKMGFVNGACYLVVPLIASFYFFRKQYREYSPSFRFIKFSYSKNILNIGFFFFIIQVVSIIEFSTGNMIISQLYGPKEVTPYNIAFRYFSTASAVFSIIMTPFWSAFTEAYFKNDFEWVKRIIKKLIRFWILYSFLILIMLVVSNFIYRIWVGKEILVPFELSVVFAFYFIINSLNLIFLSFIYGVGKVRLSFYAAIAEGIVYIPLALFLSKWLNLGISGIALASVVIMLTGLIWVPLQYSKIIEQRAKGIWNK